MLRERFNACFELANLPDTSEEERRHLLNFVVVGGGPTGTELAAEIDDLVGGFPDRPLMVLQLPDWVAHGQMHQLEVQAGRNGRLSRAKAPPGFTNPKHVTPGCAARADQGGHAALLPAHRPGAHQHPPDR